MRWQQWLSVIFAVSAIAGSSARAADGEKGLVKPSLLADVSAVEPGQIFRLGIKLEMKEHWHTYWENPGESGQATEVKLSGPKGVTFGKVRWPLPTEFNYDGTKTYGYEKEVLLTVPVTVSNEVAAGGSIEIAADLTWLCCKADTCVNGDGKVTLSVPVAAKATPANRELFDAWEKKLPVEKDDAVAKVEQAKQDGKPSPALSIEWAKTPKNVQWFPVSTAAVAIESVAVKHEGKSTQVTFKPNVFNAAEIPGNQVQSVLVYEDEAGVRRGVTVPFTLAGK